MANLERPNTLQFLLAGYLGLIALGSLYPLWGWEPLSSWSPAFLTQSLPRYITRTDVTTNLLIYIPIGYGLALLLGQPRWRNLAVIPTVLLGAAFSLTMESLQLLLPARFASNLDIFLNSLGTLIGALLSLHHGRWLRGGRRLAKWRHDWFQAGQRADLGLWLLLLWAFSQLSLRPFPGIGWLKLHLRPMDVPPSSLDQINPAWLLAVSVEIAAVGAFMTCLLRPGRYAAALLLLFISAFMLKLLAATLLLKLSLVGGILSLETILAFVAAFWLLLLHPVSRRRRGVALFFLVAIILCRLVYVESPFVPEKSILNLVGMASLISALWPWMALGLLLWPMDEEVAKDGKHQPLTDSGELED
ncbi:MAG: VanZ family protein [Gammaproteobacteria bacterium]|nr:VanZ family protein [Gammaproteobacteria bacterium]MBU1654587.1 VanZ family protein [Gammaproteobacteria bacterium]MBU1961167.1 VanZ family protein [Gammaproteobacteria bacterium]